MNAKTRKQPIRRQDRPGHIDPQHAAALRKNSSKPLTKEPEAFVTKSSSRDPLSEELGESFVRQATGASGELEELNNVVPEESGGPFVLTTGEEEFADDYDASNGTEQEPFPKT